MGKDAKMPKQELPNWVTNRNAEIAKEQAEWEKENKEYFSFPTGETKITIDMNFPPQSKISKFGKKQWHYIAEINGEAKKISVNVMLDRAIIQALSENINPMTIVRVGTGTETRYSIKELA